jgi:hypothetical protein
VKVDLTIFLGRPHFAWKPVRLEDGRTAWLRRVHRLERLCNFTPFFAGRPVDFTDRIPFCPPGPLARLRQGVRRRIPHMREHRTRLIGHALLWLLMVWLVTELIGWLYDWPRAFGGWRLDGVTLYLPGQLLLWRGLPDPGDRWPIDIALALCAALVPLVAWRAWRDITRGPASRRFGASRWATRAEVRRTGLW